MKRVINKQELRNYSSEDFNSLIRKHANLKVIGNEEPIILTGVETVELALGGRMQKGTIPPLIPIVTEQLLPSRIHLSDDSYIDIFNIEEIIIEE